MLISTKQTRPVLCRNGFYTICTMNLFKGASPKTFLYQEKNFVSVDCRGSIIMRFCYNFSQYSFEDLLILQFRSLYLYNSDLHKQIQKSVDFKYYKGVQNTSCQLTCKYTNCCFCLFSKVVKLRYFSKNYQFLWV